MMNRLLSPGLLWPLFIVALLLTSVGMSVFAIAASRSDGGVQAVPDYYALAAQYDAQARVNAASDALGWQVVLTAEELQRRGLRTLHFEVSDAAGAPVPGLVGEVSVARPNDVEAAVTVPFHARDGAYAAALPMANAGLWDVTIRAQREKAHFTQTIRVEVP